MVDFLIEGATAGGEGVRHRDDRADPVRRGMAGAVQYDELTRLDAEQTSEVADPIGLGVDVAGQHHRSERVSGLCATVPPSDAIALLGDLQLDLTVLAGSTGAFAPPGSTTWVGTNQIR